MCMDQFIIMKSNIDAVYRLVAGDLSSEDLRELKRLRSSLYSSAMYHRKKGFDDVPDIEAAVAAATERIANTVAQGKPPADWKGRMEKALELKNKFKPTRQEQLDLRWIMKSIKAKSKEKGTPWSGECAEFLAANFPELTDRMKVSCGNSYGKVNWPARVQRAHELMGKELVGEDDISELTRLHHQLKDRNDELTGPAAQAIREFFARAEITIRNHTASAKVSDLQEALDLMVEVTRDLRRSHEEEVSELRREIARLRRYERMMVGENR